MTDKHKGQIRIGKSGSIVIGEGSRESSPIIKVGKSGPIVIGRESQESSQKSYTESRDKSDIKKREYNEKKRKHDEEKRRHEEEKRRHEEEKRKRKEEKHKHEEEKRKRNEEKLKREEEEKRKRNEEKLKREEEEKRKRNEEKLKREEEEKHRYEEEKRRYDEDKRRHEKERHKYEEEMRKREKEKRKREEEEKRKREEEEKRKREEEEKRKREEEEKRKSDIENEDMTKTIEYEKQLDKVILVSTWDISCGIATYTRYLLDSIDKIAPGSVIVNPINERKLKYKIEGVLVHVQHEFGIIPKSLKIKGKVIITWHTVSKNTNDAIKMFESNCDVVAHIVHSDGARNNINSTKDIWVVPHGSALIPEMKKEDIRRLLGMNVDMPIGFVFGFQSGDKNYQRLIDAARNTGIHLIISGAKHHLASSIYIQNDSNVTFIDRFLTENEVNLYALASDILLFDYTTKDHYSVSGAMHRTIGTGRPIVCSDIKHFSDIGNDNCLKFRNQEELEQCIKRALEDSERLSIAARNYAEKTSWENVAKMHVEIYKKYTDIHILQSTIDGR